MNVTEKAITSAERSAALPLWSAKAGSGPAVAAIDLNNICRWADPARGSANNMIFVPFKTNTEWGAFVGAAETPGSLVARDIGLVHCARPGEVKIPANDPTENDPAYICYDAAGNASQATQNYEVVSYGREGEVRNEAPSGMSFTCYSANQSGPWTKTVSMITLTGLNADRAGGSSSNPAAIDWSKVINYCKSQTNAYTLSTLPKLGGYTQNQCQNYSYAQPVTPGTSALTISATCRISNQKGVLNESKFSVVDSNDAVVYASDNIDCGELLLRSARLCDLHDEHLWSDRTRFRGPRSIGNLSHQDRRCGM